MFQSDRRSDHSSKLEARAENNSGPGARDTGAVRLQTENSQNSRRHVIEYKPVWDRRLTPAREEEQGVVAVLVCHGMGQQVRYQTISSVAESILDQARLDPATAITLPVHVVLSEANDDFLARAELKWEEKSGKKHEVHVYEAYWAPLTEGKVTYWDTIKFLLRAGWRGLKCSLPWRRTFDRWVFGDARPMPISPYTSIGLLIVLSALLAVIGVIAAVSLTLAEQWKIALAQHPPSISESFRQWITWGAMFLPGVGSNPELSWPVISHVALWILLTALSFRLRYFIVQYVGDVAAYISPYKDSKFDELRHNIRKIGLNVARVIYGLGAGQNTVSGYSQVVVVGHSLGSVLAYDTLNALINQDQLCHDRQKHVIVRTRALITFGSPLDKTAFMFRLDAHGEEQWIREALAAAMQPLIVDYAYRPPSFQWINMWSPMDIISGALNYYDDPRGGTNPVHNVINWAAWVPFYAHVQYWDSKPFRKLLYDAVR